MKDEEVALYAVGTTDGCSLTSNTTRKDPEVIISKGGELIASMWMKFAKIIDSWFRLTS
jgi:hypothetical protein